MRARLDFTAVTAHEFYFGRDYCGARVWVVFGIGDFARPRRGVAGIGVGGEGMVLHGGLIWGLERESGERVLERSHERVLCVCVCGE